MRGKRKYVFGVLAVIAVLGFVTGPQVYVRYNIGMLKLNRRDTTRARTYAERLSNNPLGIKWALSDLDVYGGRASGWTMWILENSTIPDTEQRLSELATSNQSQRMEKVNALIVLWERTKDVDVLRKLFAIAALPDGLAAQLGRRALSRFISPDGNDVFEVSPDLPLPLSLDEFEVMLHGLERWNGAGNQYIRNP